MPLEPGTQVGRYLVLRSLATGGMAEVYLARSSGPEGFSKVLVLKIIHPALSEEAEFLRMFRNEATLAALLNHPNVVQVFDFGVEHDLHYMAMEYIDGQSLARVLRGLEKRGQRLPLPIALFVIGQVCEALVYAHHLTDSEGKPLNIVHRDISPENILVSYAGHVKLVDFGLVKARTLDGKTADSVVKGKYAFIAPELLQGIPYDHRADLFALGVVLYRTVLGRMPFAGEHPAEIFYQILERPPIAPRELDPTLPVELERAILRALAKAAEERYGRARDLQRDLEAVARGLGTVAGSRELAELMIATFPPGMDDVRQSYQQLAGVTTRTPTCERYIPEASPVRDLLPDMVPTVVSAATAAEVPHARRQQSGASLQPAAVPVTVKVPPPRSRRWIVLAGAAAAVTAAVLALLALRPSRRPASAVSADAAGARVDRAAAATRPAARVPFHGSLPLPSSLRSDHPPVARLPAPDARIATARDAAERPVAPALLTVLAPAPAEVYLDGHHRGPVPLQIKDVEPGLHQLRVSSITQGYELVRRLTLRPGEHLRLKVQPGRGTIRVLAYPFAQVSVDGRSIGTTPFPPVPVLEGPHRVLLENSTLKTRKEVRVRVRPGQESLVKVRLDR